MTSNMSISVIDDPDVDAVIDLWHRCKLIVPWNDPREDIAFARAQPNADILVGKLDGKIAASVMVGQDGHRGNVYYVSVAPELQGQGLGEDIMCAAIDWLKQRKVPKLNIMVRASNTKVIGFYEKLGAEQQALTNLAYWLTPNPAFHQNKDN